MTPTRHVGLRITKESADECLDIFQKMGFPNPYFYAFHNPDSGCNKHHMHFVIKRDWDPMVSKEANALRLKREYIKGKKLPLNGNGSYSFSFHSNDFVRAGNYLAHDPTASIVFVGEWDDALKNHPFQYAIQKKIAKAIDGDVEVRRTDLDHIPLSHRNIVPTMQRFDRIHNRPKQTFGETLACLMSATRYRLNRELQREGIPSMLVSEYERGIIPTSRDPKFVRYAPY